MKKIHNNQNKNLYKPWLDSYDEGVPKSIDYPNLMLWELLKETTKKYPSYIAYEYYGTSVTFRKFMLEIEEVARSLKAIGVNSDDIVTICAPNIPEAIISFYAINMIGAIANMIHPLSSSMEIEEYLKISKSKFVLAIDVTCKKILDVIERTDVIKVVVMSASEKMNKFVKLAYYLTEGRKLNISYDNDSVIPWNSFLDYGYMYDGDYVVKKNDTEAAVILYSGGTTGKSKGIVLSNRNFNAATMQTTSMIQPVIPGDSILTIMPIFHAFGLNVCIHTPLCSGVKCILVPVFNYKKFGRLIKQYKPNFIVGVPSLLETMISDSCLENLDMSFVKQIITGGDVISVDLKKRVDEFMRSRGSFATARPGYGLTEGSGASCLLPFVNQPEGSIGVPVQDMCYKIIDTKTGHEVPYGEEGEICISGPNVMLGYLNEPLETEKAMFKDKNDIWLHTGDLGKMDKNGFVYFTQRLKRIIVSSGYNLYPSHIEEVIMKHRSVKNVCVVGVPHPYKGQVAKAYIVLKDNEIGLDLIKKEIKDLCKIYLSKFSNPYEFEFRDQLPMTMLGKVDYKVLEHDNK